MWKCSCGHTILGFAKYCPAALSPNHSIGAEHRQVSSNSPDWLQSLLVTSELKMNPQEELFAKFYNIERVLVKDMDAVQLREHREELQQIAFEAKARLVAADEENKERKAKASNKEWLVTDTTQPYDVSAAINVVKVRQARMSKADKMIEQLRKINMDEATIKEMVSNITKKASDPKLKTITFNVPSTEMKAIQVNTQKPNGPVEPFDPSKLKFDK